jgi:hypothetical protein
MRKLRRDHPDFWPNKIRYFWTKVASGKSRQCWEWLGGKDKDSYGLFPILGVPVRAHRFAMQIKLGRELQTEEQVLHSCDNPSCCNPNHLFLGDNAKNMADRNAKGRQARNKGSKNGASVLTKDQVLQIRKRLDLEGWRRGLQADLAAEFKVSRQTITNIKLRRRWKHLL